MMATRPQATAANTMQYPAAFPAVSNDERVDCTVCGQSNNKVKKKRVRKRVRKREGQDETGRQG